MKSSEFKYEVVEYLAGTVLEIGPGAKSFPHLLKVGTPGIDESPDIRVEDAGDLSLVIEDGSCDAMVIRAPISALMDRDFSLADWVCTMVAKTWALRLSRFQEEIPTNSFN